MESPGTVNIRNKLMIYFLTLFDILASINLINVNNGNPRSNIYMFKAIIKTLEWFNLTVFLVSLADIF